MDLSVKFRSLNFIDNAFFILKANSHF